MSKIMIGILMLIGVGLLAGISTVVRRKLVLSLDKSSIFRMLFSWPFFILIGMLALTLILNFIANYYLTVPQSLIVGWVLAFPTFLFSAAISNFWLGETMQRGQWGSLGVIVVGTLICSIGAYQYFRGTA